MGKLFRKIFAYTIILAAVFCMFPTTEVEAAATGYTDHPHTWYPSGKNDDCIGCKAKSGYTDCSTCSHTGKVTCTTCGGDGIVSKTVVNASGTIKVSNVSYTYASKIEYRVCYNCGGTVGTSGYDYCEYYASSGAGGTCFGVACAGSSNTIKWSSISEVAGSGKVSCTKCGGDGALSTTCQWCNGYGVNYKCTNSQCTLTNSNDNYDNWETEEGYSAVCYTTANTFTIKYDSNGGSGSMANTTVTYGTSTAIRTNSFKKTGHTFSGWTAYRASDGKTVYTNGTSTGWYVEGSQPDGYTKHIYSDGQKVAKTSAVDGDTVTFSAVWTANTFTVEYNSNGGSGSMSSTTVTYGTSTATSANAFTKTGSTFSGWTSYRESDGKCYYQSSDGSSKGWYVEGSQPDGYTKYIYPNKTKLATTSSVDGDTITLSAVWTANTFTIEYDSNGGSGSMSSTTVTYGTSTTIRSNTFTKTGYTFSGWTAHRASDGKTVYTNGTSTGWYVEGSQPDGYTKHIYSDGQKVAKTSAVDGDTVTFSAQWSPKTYVLTLNSNYTGATSTTVNVTFGNAYGSTLPTLSREGYEFLGWYNGTSDSATQITSTSIVSTAANHTLHAKWQVHTHNVFYDLNGGQSLSISEDSLPVDYGAPIDLTPSVIKHGYTFVGWAYEKDGQCIQSATMPDKDVTLYAQFTLPVSGLMKATFRIWDANGNSAEIEIPAIENRLNGSTYATNGLNILTSYAGDTSNYNAKIKVYDYAGNYAEWELTPTDIEEPTPPKEYDQTTVHYFYHVANQAYNSDLTVSIVEKITDNATYAPFVLPYTTSNGTTFYIPTGYASEYKITYPEGYEVTNGAYNVKDDTKTVVVYHPNKYTLTLNSNAGTFSDGNSLYEKEVQYTDYYNELPIPTRTGYTFAGWYTAQGGSIGTVAGEQIVSTDIYYLTDSSTLYAAWTPQKHTVTFDWTTNGGTSVSGLPDGQAHIEVEYGTLVTITTTAFKTGFDFFGWSKDDSTSGNTNIVTSFVMPDADVVLFAQFKKDIELRFVDEDGERAVTGRYWNTSNSIEVTIPAIRDFGAWEKMEWRAADDSVYDPNGGNFFAKDSNTYYAYFKKDVKAEFVVPSDVASIAPVNTTLYYHTGGAPATFTVSLPTPPARNKYSFVRWESSDGQTFAYASKPSSGAWTATFYDSVQIEAVWDKYPTLTVQDRYFTLKQAVSGVITIDELLSSAKGQDEEDGTLSKNNGLSITDYDENEFVGLTSSTTISLTYEAKDSFGNTVTKSATIHIINTKACDTEISEEARFIDVVYVYTSDSSKDEDKDGYLDGRGNTVNYGGLRATSLWKSNSVYASTLNKALSNSNVPVMSYTFTSKDIDDMKDYVKENGFANFKSEQGRINFIDRFLN